jgi:hypothetical protein
VVIDQSPGGRLRFADFVGRESAILPSSPQSVGVSVSAEWNEEALVGGGTVPIAGGVGAQTVSIDATVPYQYDPALCGGIATASDFMGGRLLVDLVEAIPAWGDKVRLRVYETPTSPEPYIDQVGFIQQCTREWEHAYAEKVSFVHVAANRGVFTRRKLDAMNRGSLSRVSSDALLMLLGIPEQAPFAKYEKVENWCRRILLNTSYADVIKAFNYVNKDGFYDRNPANGEPLKNKDPLRKRRPEVLRVPPSIRNMA